MAPAPGRGPGDCSASTHGCRDAAAEPSRHLFSGLRYAKTSPDHGRDRLSDPCQGRGVGQFVLGQNPPPSTHPLLFQTHPPTNLLLGGGGVTHPLTHKNSAKNLLEKKSWSTGDPTRLDGPVTHPRGRGVQRPKATHTSPAPRPRGSLLTKMTGNKKMTRKNSGEGKQREEQ